MPAKKSPVKQETKESKRVLRFPNVLPILSGMFFTIWIVIGLFLFVVLVQGFRRGAFNSLLQSKAPTTTSQETANAPQEATLPGIGRVNVLCVQRALDQQGIQKLLDGGEAALTEEEKAKFVPCVVEREATPSPTPAG